MSLDKPQVLNATGEPTDEQAEALNAEYAEAMRRHQEAGGDGPPPEAPRANVGARNGPVPGSLRDRMQKRTEEISRRTTEIFPVPMYDEMLAVELKVIPWAKTEEAVNKNQRITSSLLGVAGDELTAATIGFFEVQMNDSGFVLEQIEEPVSWKRLATDLAGKKLPDIAGERVALIAMCGDQGVMALNGAYRQWLGGKETGLSRVAQEVRRDF